MAIWVGLTGGIGSGKSAAAQYFADLGVPRIDADAVAHALTDSDGIALPKIRQLFGDRFFDNQGMLKRDMLRKEVFASNTQKTLLESVMLPLIFSEIKKQQETFNDTPYGIVEIPLLTEKRQFMKLIQRVLTISAPLEERIVRVMKRSGLSRKAVSDIICHQAEDRDRLLLTDDALLNDGNMKHLHDKIRRLHTFYSSIFTMQQIQEKHHG